MANFGNTPYPIARSMIRKKRRKRIAIGAGMLGLGALFGTKRGKNLMGMGIKKLATYHPAAAKGIGRGLSFMYSNVRRGRRAVGGFVKPHAATFLQKAFNRFPTQTTKVMGGLSRTGGWISKLKPWLKALPRF